MTRRGVLTLVLGAADVRRRVALRRQGALSGCRRARAGAARGPNVGARSRRADPPAAAHRRRTARPRRPAGHARSKARTSGSRSRRARSHACPRPRSSSRSRSPGSASGRRRSGMSARSTAGTYVLERVPRGRYVVERGAGDDRRPVRARARRGRARIRERPARLSAARRARPALFRERSQRPGREASAAAPPVRLRPPLGARVRAGRVAAQGALADDRATWPADGQGARGRAARRDRRPARCGRDRSQRRELRRPGARRGVDPARARGSRPPCRARDQLRVAAERACLLARRGVARRARAARRGAAGRDASRGRAAGTGERDPRRGRSRRWW